MTTLTYRSSIEIAFTIIRIRVVVWDIGCVGSERHIISLRISVKSLVFK